MNIHDLPATPTRLRYVAGRLGLGRRAYERAREIAGTAPNPREWPTLMDRFLLLFGTVLIVAGITAFFAYNWAGLHRFWKFGLVEGGIVAAVGLAWWRGLDSGAGRSALFGAAFLVGVLFALYGQVYQTGADPYGLFLTWGLLVLGWAVIGRQAGLWMLLLILTNLTVTLFWTQVLHPVPVDLRVFGPLMGLSGTFTDARLADLVFALNVSALVLWEFMARRGVSWMQGRTFPRVVSLLALGPVVVSSLMLIFGVDLEDGRGWHLLALFLFLGFAFASLSYFRHRVHDLFILTVCLVSGILMVTSLVARYDEGTFEMFLVLAALVVGQTTGAAVWLRHVSQEWEERG